MRKSIALLLRLFLAASIFMSSDFVIAQNVGIGTNAPHVSAQLEVSSNQRGFLPPRMTFAERNAIVNPAQGLIIYCTDCGTRGEAQIFDGAEWTNLTGGLARQPLPTYDTTVPSVTIGTQIWSSKNLDVAKYRNGDPIPQVTDPTQWANLTTGAWCWYNNDSAFYAATYGRLYNWYAVNDPRGLAPQGWHVPTDADWNKLVKYLDASADTTCQGCYQSIIAGGAMKSTTGWNSPNTGATNSSGFTGLPGGHRNDVGNFYGLGYDGYFWSSTELNTYNALDQYLNYSGGGVGKLNYGKPNGFSVRCLRD